MANKILKGFYGKDGEKYELPETDNLVGKDGAGDLQITKNGDGNGQLELSLHCSDPNDEFFEKISRSQISNAIHPVSTPVAGSERLITSGGVKAALDGKRDLVGQTISLVINGQEIEIKSSDVPNLIRALSNPDSTPTANSDNLVISGGVKTALDSKMDNRGVDTTPRNKSSNLITSGAVYTAINNISPSSSYRARLFECGLNSFIYLPNLFNPSDDLSIVTLLILNETGENISFNYLFRADYEESVWFLTDHSSITEVMDCSFLVCRVIKMLPGHGYNIDRYFVTFDGDIGW